MRAILSEFLPYELPAGFSNSGLYAFLIRNGAHFQGRDFLVKSSSADVHGLLALLLGPKTQRMPHATPDGEWTRFSGDQMERKSVPYRFRIKHGGLNSRELSIPHPRVQLAFVNFYDQYRSLITHFGQSSQFSIRTPVKEARVTVVRDDLFAARRSSKRDKIETAGHEHDRLRSFFVYESFENIHGFYDSVQYLDAEKTFAHMLKLDVARCFDSIYSHSIEWAVYGRENIKSNRSSYKGTFPNRFDRLMMAMNEDETNGILIGPEVSRIFAELILQRIDRDIHDELANNQLQLGVDYVAFRYVDDYFFFYNSPGDRETIQEAVARGLKPYKLSIQEAKVENVVTPHLTPLSLAKVEVRRFTEALLSVQLSRQEDGSSELQIGATGQSQSLINAYKTVLAHTVVEPRDLANYALVQVEERLEEALRALIKAQASELSNGERARLESALAKLLSGAIEYAYFVHSGSGLASAAVKATRISALALKASESLSKSLDRAEHIRQMVFSEVSLQMIRHPMSETATIEGLYLLDVLGELSEDYFLPSQALREFLDFSIRSDGAVDIPGWFHAAAALTAMRYMKDDPRYAPIRTALEDWMIQRICALLEEEDDHAERSILALDLMTCPYVSMNGKRKILAMHKASSSAASVNRVTALARQWFTNWDRKDLHSDLLDKRSQHVY